MSRLAPLEPDNMPPRQREAYEDLIANQRGGVRGPFGVWLRSPGLVIALRGLMKFYYEESVITEDIRELAIIIITTAPFRSDLRLLRARGPGACQRADARPRGRRDGAGGARRGHRA